MKSFELVEPSTLDEAVSLLDPEDRSVRAIAGGTALMLMMKTRLFQPTRLVSLRHLNGDLRGIHAMEHGGLRIGAMTSLAELEYSPMLASTHPVMSRALRTLSNIRVRNVATLGGHLAHGDPHMDLPPLLSVLGASLTIAGPKGERNALVEALYAGYLETTLAAGEIITRITVPALGSRRAAYLKCTT